MKEKESKVKEISMKEIDESLLLEIELADTGMETIVKYFEGLRGRVENDDSRENYWMMGFSTGFELARKIHSDYSSMAIINSSRKLHGES